MVEFYCRSSFFLKFLKFFYHIYGISGENVISHLCLFDKVSSEQLTLVAS